jgi:phenylacetaldehyde dehydrogenase
MDTLESLLAAIAPTGASRDILNPANGDLVAKVAVDTVDDLEKAIAAATKAQVSWAALGHEKRSALMMKAADAIEAHAEPLAQLLSREQGKPLNGPNARFEIGGAAAWMRAAAATPLETETVIDDESGHAVMTYKPIGVVAAIGPWNWPAMITIWQVAPSIRMGNAVIVKPSEFTPLIVTAIVKVINTVLPAGVVTVISGDREVGAALSAQRPPARPSFVARPTRSNASR